MSPDPNASSSESGKRSSDGTVEVCAGGGRIEQSLLDFIKSEVASLAPKPGEKDSSSSDEFKDNYFGNKRRKSGHEGDSPSLR